MQKNLCKLEATDNIIEFIFSLTNYILDGWKIGNAVRLVN